MSDTPKNGSPPHDAAHQEAAIFVLGQWLQDIRDLKHYQWKTSHFAVLAQAGLFAVATVGDSPPSGPYRWLLVFTSALIVFAWFRVNQSIEDGLEISRAGKDETYRLLPIDIQSTRPPEPKTNRQDAIHRTMRWIVILAAVVVSALILLQ